MENNQQQPPVIDLCSSSSDDDGGLQNNDNYKINDNVARRRRLKATTTSTARPTTIFDNGKNPKRARMASAAEARMQQEQRQQQPQPPPQKQQQQRRLNHHPHHVAECSTTTMTKSKAPAAASRKTRPQAGAAAATAAAATTESEEPLVFLNAHARDSAIVTTGIGPLLAKLPSTKMNNLLAPPNVVTCCCSSTTTTTTSQRYHLSLHHVQQPDQWSCGFRNLQMLLFALVPQLERHHGYFHFHGGTGGGGTSAGDAVSVFAIPSLPEIEQALESAWMDGFDDKGRDHYRGKIVGKRAWVGAVEIWSVLSYWSLDACVVQFIRTATSRRKLGPFLYAHFTKQQHDQQQPNEHDNDNNNSMCMFCSPMPTASTQDMASKLLTIASSSSSAPRHQHDPGNSGGSLSCCSCPVLPVYLQWKGHSVTVIGMEMSSCPNNSSRNGTTTANLEPVNLLVLDPGKNGQAITSSLAQGNLNNNSSKSKIRLPLHRLASQDVQVILASTRNITEQERMARKVNINAITA